MHLKIHLINNTIFDSEARRITLNTPMGEISILDNHEPMITLVEYGNIYVETNEGEKLFSFPGGVLEVISHSEVVLLSKHI